jgi:hypothetical protein
MVSKLVDHGVDGIVGPFDAGHHVAQDKPKILGRNFKFRIALAWQKIFDSTMFLVWH